MISDMPAYGNNYVEIRINRRLLIALIASLLVHALLLISIRPNLQMSVLPVGNKDSVLSVRLSPPGPTHKPSKQPVFPRPRAQVPSHHAPMSMRVTPPKQAVLTAPREFATPAPATPPEAAPTDMASYIAAVRARRQMVEREAGAESQPSVDEIRNANINRNLRPQGGGGIFYITRIDTQTAAFSFRGWDNAYNNGRREEIEVEADAGTDIEHAIIRKMIAIIRKRHKGDFGWESQTLNRVVTLSARLEDNAGLEDFLMREFFKAGLRPSEQ